MQRAPLVSRSILAPRRIGLRTAVNAASVWDAELVIGIGLHNQAASLHRCLSSVFAQVLGGRSWAVVLLDDCSTDDWSAAADEFRERPELVVLAGHCGSAARTRNAILDFVDASFPRARWVARLDADDRFTTPHSLAAACEAGERQGARFVLGGNRLVRGGELLERANPACRDLLHADDVLARLRAMAEGSARNELPSCNLVLAAGAGWRYPDLTSAEDHWLVADLLLNHGSEGAILEAPFYCDYTLCGSLTTANQGTNRYLQRRRRLFAVASTWVAVQREGGEVLGLGQEGVVCRVGPWIEKRFYPGVIGSEAVDRLRRWLRYAGPHLPDPDWEERGGQWVCRYADKSTTPAKEISLAQAHAFLAFCLSRGLVCRNIKRANFRIDAEGNLVMIDIGNDILPMDASVFRDSAARVYAIAALGWEDGELARRRSQQRQDEVLAELPGFAAFYRDLLTGHAEQLWAGDAAPLFAELSSIEPVTLLIKACAMDAAVVEVQVRHIVGHLATPRRFSEVLLLVDPFRGPFLRQHCPGDLDRLLDCARDLRDRGVIDRLLVAPEHAEAATELNRVWFGIDCPATHTAKGVPVASQLWAFDQVSTRYVLQCDIDVLIGRRDLSHDYLADMLAAAAPADVLGVAFNIPKAPGPAVAYDAAPGAFVPEVRCGLLDLERVRACRPLPNALNGPALMRSWYRSLEQHQQAHGLRTLRGGDPCTFYVHPTNDRKADQETLDRARDLVGQGLVPEAQWGAWDWGGTAEEWRYPPRSEEIVFLLKGRNTPQEKICRCLASLRAQDDQAFGVVLVDDASTEGEPALLPGLLGSLRSKTTLVRRPSPAGRIPNFLTAIGDICVDPETLVVILDLDDALMHGAAVTRLRAAWAAGHDVVLANCFRPDKPLKLYEPDLAAPRAHGGGEVWPHLRAFRKRLFDSVPVDYFQLDGEWVEECTDYATMLPMVEVATRPLFIPEYLYFHQRSTSRTPEARARKDAIIRRLLAKPPMPRSA